jgi:hypothetical protein
MRGIKITHKENSKSYHKDNNERVTRIEVESELYDFDTIYQDVTLDTEYSNWLSNNLKKTLNEIIKA